MAIYRSDRIDTLLQETCSGYSYHELSNYLFFQSVLNVCSSMYVSVEVTCLYSNGSFLAFYLRFIYDREGSTANDNFIFPVKVFDVVLITHDAVYVECIQTALLVYALSSKCG